MLACAALAELDLLKRLKTPRLQPKAQRTLGTSRLRSYCLSPPHKIWSASIASQPFIFPTEVPDFHKRQLEITRPSREARANGLRRTLRHLNFQKYHVSESTAATPTWSFLAVTMGALDKAAKCVATALLSSATAQVLSPTAANSDPPVDDFLFNALPARDAQIGLNFEKATTDRWMTGYFTKHQQDNTTCPTYGESQWTGTVTVRNDRSLFYWYFDSRDDPENDPLIVWLNGGPGASSMMGLFTEMGPCWLEPNAPTAQPNPWSWNNNASLLFVDQPAGAGLSSLREGSSEPTNEEDTAKDFLSFLEIFFGDVFPNNKNRRIHIAAESYGGHYGPVYIQHVLQSQHQASVPFEGRIESLILINSVLDWTANFLGVYDFLCQERERVGLLNATACEYISSSMPEQEVLGRKCRLSYGGRECRAAFDHGMATIGAPFLDVAKADNRYMANSTPPSAHV